MNYKKKKPRILLISDHFYPESFLGNEIPQYLRDNGAIVDILTQNPSYPEGRLYPGHVNPFFRITRMHGIRVFRFKTITGYQDSLIRKMANYLWFMVASSIFTVCTAISYDAVFVYHVGTLTEALPLYIAKRLYGKRTSIWTLDIWPDSVFSFGFKRSRIFKEMLNSFVSAIYRSCDCIMVGSPGFITKLTKYSMPNIRPMFIPQWAPKELFAGAPSPISFDIDYINFVFAGNVGTQQNLKRVITAFANLAKNKFKTRLHIVGDGRSMPEVKSLARMLGGSFIFIHDRIPQGQVLNMLRASDACVLSLNPDPAIELTLPAKFQTYLFSERPILCVARGESKLLVESNRIGEVGEPDSVESIAAAILRICQYSKEKKTEVALRMKELAKTEFQEEKSKQRILMGIIASAGQRD